MCARATSGCTTSSGCRCRSRVSGRLWVARRWWPRCDPPPPTSRPARGRRTRSAAWKSRLRTASSTSSLSVWQVGGGGRTLKTWIVSATRWCQKHSKSIKKKEQRKLGPLVEDVFYEPWAGESAKPGSVTAVSSRQSITHKFQLLLENVLYKVKFDMDS